MLNKTLYFTIYFFSFIVIFFSGCKKNDKTISERKAGDSTNYLKSRNLYGLIITGFDNKLVKINQNNGSYISINNNSYSLLNNNSLCNSTLDSNKGVFYYRSGDTITSSSKFYTININNGGKTSSFLFKGIKYNDVTYYPEQFQFCKSENCIYALQYDGTGNKLISINSENKISDVSDYICNKQAYTSTFNQKNNQYIFLTKPDNSLKCKLYIVRTDVGVIVNQTYVDLFYVDNNIYYLNYINFSSKLNKLYSVFNVKNKSQLLEINVETGKIYIISEIKYIKNIYSCAFDEKNNNYVVIGSDTLDTKRIFTFDISGKIIFNPSINDFNNHYPKELNFD